MSNLFETILCLSHLNEMANYHKRDLLLPVNVWLDGGKTYLKGSHYKRVKFQINYGNSIQRKNFASVSLDDNTVIDKEKVLKKRKCEISRSDMHEVETFCANNNFALLALSDEILTESEFLAVVIKGGEEKPEEDRQKMKALTKEIIKKNLQEGRYAGEELQAVQNFLSL